MELKYKQELESTRKWKRKKKKKKTQNRKRIAVVKVGSTKTKTMKGKKEGLGNGMYLAEKKRGAGGWVKGLVGIGLVRRWRLNQWDGELWCWKKGGWMSLYRKWELRERVELPQHELHIEHTDSYRGMLRTWRLLVSSWLRLNFYYNNPFVLLLSNYNNWYIY